MRSDDLTLSPISFHIPRINSGEGTSPYSVNYLPRRTSTLSFFYSYNSLCLSRSQFPSHSSVSEWCGRLLWEASYSSGRRSDIFFCQFINFFRFFISILSPVLFKKFFFFFFFRSHFFHSAILADSQLVPTVTKNIEERALNDNTALSFQVISTLQYDLLLIFLMKINIFVDDSIRSPSISCTHLCLLRC